ncbi:ATP-binding cassette domain-containing protein [Haloechinothrix sp. LS1_15]|uniref:ABC transporter ATP-binding protein n=1 Tax=Haloechinothrix sp. LS1_15 TaxID=2652248 RepID=UPI002943FCEF|nr:ATP-binding cassette domain-containing protein [Haloechinothrix sp. LS1_15]MDV6014336.1 ABC transporter ATP-binding protein [Haloechinothrix sp. LS1_15]
MLEVIELTKRYGDITALEKVSFTVRSGELFGFVGSNGAGKTTAMRIMLGVLAQDAGRVRFDGNVITPEVRARFGYMPEERGLYPKMKVLDQLTYLAQLHGRSANAAHTAAEHWLARLDLRERRHDEVQKLSLGNQQRVQLAAALVHEPTVLVLDEPFSGLDPVAVDMMSGVLREQAAAGVPIVFSSHQLDLVERLCDRVGIIRNGQMVATGTVEELSAGAVSQLRVVVPGAPAGWARGLDGTRVLSEQDSTTLLELEPDADEQAVLRAAMEHGPVTEFSKHRLSLAELFRHVVTEGSAA